MESGFSRKSSAPARTASIAVFTSPWPEIMMTGVDDPAGAQLRERVEAVLAGHLDVEQDRVVVRRLGHRVQARRDGGHLVALLRQERAQGLADVGFVVADEDAARHPEILAALFQGATRLLQRPRRLLDPPGESFGGPEGKRFFE